MSGRRITPGGQNRPYKAPQAVTAKHKTYHYYIRRYVSTIEARGEAERELLRDSHLQWQDGKGAALSGV